MERINPQRGEISAMLDGKPLKLVLTLGALAELEHALGAGDLAALAARMSSGTLSARDCIAIIGAGLRGGGHDIGNDEVELMAADGGARGFVDIVARLLKATFSSGEEGGAARQQNPHLQTQAG